MSKKNKTSSLNRFETYKFYNNTDLGRTLKVVISMSSTFKVGEYYNIRNKVTGELSKGGCASPALYVVSFIDQHGIPWLRRVSRRRGYAASCAPFFRFINENYDLVLDQDYLASVILEEKFNPKRAGKMERQDAARKRTKSN